MSEHIGQYLIRLTLPETISADFDNCMKDQKNFSTDFYD